MAVRAIGAMPLTVGDRPVRPLTATEVMAMVDAGIVADDAPVELLHGALTELTPRPRCLSPIACQARKT